LEEERVQDLRTSRVSLFSVLNLSFFVHWFMRNALIGLLVAGALAVSVSGATLFGIDAWKIVLAAVGAVIFVMGAERRPRGGR
jgi:hypothetical protein